ncbi:MAG: hypothetical protein EZS28_030148 [Streblomastix strix]|uniref:Uncharacterized protein n=1 Tax=Streblomastix strix TaxID=222440 RepID=A0A5J4UUL1_9EUKA|nr:MAG: hypothetical protein EZS28_030148 [Streblomastix strix]
MIEVFFLTEDWTITNCFINTLNKTLYWKSREIPHYASIFSRNIQELVFRVIVPRIEYIIFAQKYKSLQGNWESRNDDFTSIRGAYFKYVSNRLQLKFNDFINNELMKAEKEAEVYLGSSDEGSNNHLLFDGDRIILNVAEQQEDQEEDEFSLLSFHQQGLSEILKTYMQLREMLGAPPTYHPLFQNIIQDLIKQGQLGRNIEDVTKEMEQKKEKKKQNEEKTQNSDDHETKKKNPTVSFLLYDRNELESKLQIHTITILCRSLQSLEVSIQHQKQKVEQMLQDEKDEEERIKKEKEKEKEKESKLENVITRQIELNRKEQKDQNEDDEDEDVKQDERTVENSADYEIKKIKPLSYFVSESVSDLQNRYQYDCTALHRKILLSIIHAIVDPIFFTAAQTLPETQNAGQTISMNVSAAFAIVLRPTMMLDDIMADAIDFAAIRMLGKDFPQGNMKLPTIQFPSKSDLVNSSDDQEFLHTFF